MEFTFSVYRGLLSLLQEQGYAFRSYQDYVDAARCVILRHNVDQSLSQAVRLAELEAEEGGIQLREEMPGIRAASAGDPRPLGTPQIKRRPFRLYEK